MSTSQPPRDQQQWYRVTEYLFEITIAVQGFPDDHFSAPRSTTEQDLEEVFREFGLILHKQIWRSQKGGLWAFITYNRPDERNAAINSLNGRTVDMHAQGSRRRIKWNMPLKVCIPRFHSLRLNYDQYAAARFVPPELSFTPAAEPGQGGTYQASRKPGQSPFHPSTSPRHGRSQSNTVLINHDLINNYDRPPSRAHSHDGSPIQWGHEPAAEMPETPSGSFYDSEATYCGSGKGTGHDYLFRADAPRSLPARDNEDDSRYRRAASPSEPNPTISRRSPSLAPSSHCDNHDDSSVYPPSSRATPEPSSRSRKRRREDVDREDEDLQAQITRLEEENNALRRELDDAQDRETKKDRQAEADRKSLAVIQELVTLICPLIQQERAQKRSRLEPQESGTALAAFAPLMQLLASQALPNSGLE